MAVGPDGTLVIYKQTGPENFARTREMVKVTVIEYNILRSGREILHKEVMPSEFKALPFESLGSETTLDIKLQCRRFKPVFYKDHLCGVYEVKSL